MLVDGSMRWEGHCGEPQNHILSCIFTIWATDEDRETGLDPAEACPSQGQVSKSELALEIISIDGNDRPNVTT